MRRIVGTLTSLLPTLVCLGLVVLWVTSYWYVVVLAVCSPVPAVQGVSSRRGSVVLLHANVRLSADKPWDAYVVAGPIGEFSASADEAFEPPNLKLSLAGFRVAHGRLTPPMLTAPYTAVAVPHAFVVALAALPPALSVRRAVRGRRWRRQGRCTRCGYDLRSSPSRCPECGAGADGDSATGGGPA